MAKFKKFNYHKDLKYFIGHDVICQINHKDFQNGTGYYPLEWIYSDLYSEYKFLPILRKIEDLSNGEYLTLFQLTQNLNNTIDIWDKVDYVQRGLLNWKSYPVYIFERILSYRIDLLGLIDSGNAINQKGVDYDFIRNKVRESN